MKILFINKYDITGGAGIIATRLQKSLQKQFQAECGAIVGIKNSNEKNVFCSRHNSAEIFVERGLNYLLNRLGIQYYWLPISTPEIRKRTLEFDPDIISLHNIHGGYFDTSLIVELSRIAPVVWTLHDMWAFTGNAAHTFEDTSWKEMKAGPGERHQFPQIGLPTGSWLLKRKKKIYRNSNLTIITPSEWLHNLASSSPVFTTKRVVHIPNGLDLSLFKPTKEASRALLNIPADAKVLMFTAEKLAGNEYKGGEDLIEILRQINSYSTETIYLLIVGKGNLQQLSELQNFDIHALGYVNDEHIMARCFSASDLFIYPTKADTLPNALIESIACSTPAVTYDIGGCGEIIKNEQNGYVLPPFNTRLFAERVIYVLQNAACQRRLSTRARTFAEERFSIESMSDAYYSLFKELV
jgi:glycosyltransferase involved in cell wall biosynthesis